MRLKLGPTIGSVLALSALAAWHIYQRTLRTELRGAWWSHLITTILGAVTVVMIIETVRSAARENGQPLISGTPVGYFPVGAGIAPAALPGAVNNGQYLPYPVAVLDDIERTGQAPDFSVRIAPEGFYLWRGGQWEPGSHKDLKAIKGSVVMVQNEGGRELVRSQVFETLNEGNNQIISET